MEEHLSDYSDETTSSSTFSTEEVFPHVEQVEEFIHTDADQLMHHFKDAYDKVRGGLSKPRVLIVGVAGAGKSSIINSVFGSNIAKEGAGKPITQHFQKFEPDSTPIILYDSKGLEVGMQMDECIESTLEYFTKCNGGEKEKCMEKQIDMVWYIVNSASARFQDFEEHLCKELFQDLPIIFILNKSDISTEEQRDSLTQVIKDMKLKNCIGIYSSITQKYCSIYTPETCELCNSEDIVVFRRKKRCMCENCGHGFSIIQRSGLEEIIQAAFSALPMIVKESFVAAQRLSFQLKEKRAKKCIKDFYHHQSKTLTAHGLLSLLATMLTRLSFVWDFREHAHLSATVFARDVVGTFSLRDKIFLFMHKNKHQRLRSTAIGIIWNRCVRELATIMLIESVEGVSEKTAKDQWPLILHDVFHFLSAENIDCIEDKLRNYTLKGVLRAEMPIGDSQSEDLNCIHTKHRSSIPALCEGKDYWNGWLTPTGRHASTPELLTVIPSPLVQDKPREKRKKHSRKKSKSSKEGSKKVKKRSSKRKLNTHKVKKKQEQYTVEKRENNLMQSEITI